MKSSINATFALLALLLLLFVLLLSTPLRPPLSTYLSLGTQLVAGTGLLWGTAWGLRRVFRHLQSPTRSAQTIPLRQTAICCLFLTWMALGFFMAVLQGMFAPTWVRSETVQGKTYDIIDESFLDPACRVTQRRYVFWSKDITGFKGDCDPRTVTLKTTAQGIEAWSGKRLLGTAPAF